MLAAPQVPLSPCADHTSLPLIFFGFHTLFLFSEERWLSFAISWGYQHCLTGEGVLKGKRQSCIPWYLSSKLKEMGCTAVCICSRHLPKLTLKCGKLSPVKHSRHQAELYLFSLCGILLVCKPFWWIQASRFSIKQLQNLYQY